MNSQLSMDQDFIRSVVRHMNTDHPDACLNIVRAYSDHPGACSAQLRDLDKENLFFMVEPAPLPPAEPAPDLIEVAIAFPVPLRNELQVRGALIDLAGKARELLAAARRAEQSD